MHLAPKQADLFTNQYKQLLLKIAELSGEALPKPAQHLDKFSQTIQNMGAARELWLTRPGLLAQALETLANEGTPIDSAVVHAVQTMQVETWVYLKDLSHYAVFLGNEPTKAYAVYGLNSAISDIVGGAGCMIETGVCEYAGRYVCDGLIVFKAWIGNNMRRDLHDEYQALKKAGQFLIEPPVVQPVANHLAVRDAPPKSAARKAGKPQRAKGSAIQSAAPNSMGNPVFQVFSLEVPAAQRNAFQAALPDAFALLAQAQGYVDSNLRQAPLGKDSEQYTLLIGWQNAQALKDFCASQAYAQWQLQMAPFLSAQPAVMELDSFFSRGK